MYLDPHHYANTNRRALLSLSLAILALLSFCVGAVPLPFSALFCYPATFLFGLGALWTGLTALREIRQTAEQGYLLAKIGIWAGGVTVLFVVCATTVVLVLTPYLIEFFKTIGQ